MPRTAFNPAFNPVQRALCPSLADFRELRLGFSTQESADTGAIKESYLASGTWEDNFPLADGTGGGDTSEALTANLRADWGIGGCTDDVGQGEGDAILQSNLRRIYPADGKLPASGLMRN